MNTKTSWVLLGLVFLAVLFVPLIPNDAPIDCGNVTDSSLDACDKSVGYISVYTKFFAH
jgi:hypothetical protein